MPTATTQQLKDFQLGLENLTGWVCDQERRVHAAQMLRLAAKWLDAAGLPCLDASRAAQDAECAVMLAAGWPEDFAAVYGPGSLKGAQCSA